MSLRAVHDFLCDGCKNLFSAESLLNQERKQDASDIHVPHLHIKAIRKSYAKGCHFCALILHTIDGVESRPWSEMCEWKQEHLSSNLRGYQYLIEDDFVLWIRIAYVDKGLDGDIWSIF